MICPDYMGMDNPVYLAGFNRKALDERIPINGGIDLTSACNLRCRHCYINGAGDCMSAGRICEIIDQAVGQGCLFLLMTGGEPMMHPEFAAIYKYARESGLVVTLFTNGTLVDDAVAGLLSDYPPAGVEVSIYGATAAVHDSIAGVVGAFDAALRGVDLLLRAGVKVSIKTMLMALNLHEFAAIRELAGSLGVKFRMDPALFPRLSGDRAPVDLRVAPEEAVACEFSIPGRREEWRSFVKRMESLPESEDLYVCGAGRTGFHINSRGDLQPCIMTPHIKADLSRMSFEEAWRLISGKVTGLRPAAYNPCVACGNRLVCESCPGFIMLETGDENGRAEYLCRLAEARAAGLNAAV